jgi:hypothetical protein
LALLVGLTQRHKTAPSFAENRPLLTGKSDMILDEYRSLARREPIPTAQKKVPLLVLHGAQKKERKK